MLPPLCLGSETNSAHRVEYLKKNNLFLIKLLLQNSLLHTGEGRPFQMAPCCSGECPVVHSDVGTGRPALRPVRSTEPGGGGQASAAEGWPVHEAPPTHTCSPRGGDTAFPWEPAAQARSRGSCVGTELALQRSGW